MMTEEMMKQMPHMMGSAGSMVGGPLGQGAMLAGAGFAAGRSLLFRNPLAILAAGVAAGVVAGYLMHRYEKEILTGLSRASGMGRDFVLHQKENLADLMAEATEGEEPAPAAPAAASTATPAAEPGPSA